MRAREIITEAAGYAQMREQDLESLKAACENWMEMYFDANDINTILSHPYSQQFKQPPSGIDRLYRGLVVKGNQIKAVPGKSNRKFIAYATHQYGAEAFLASLDIGGRQVIVEKQFNPADFILDFTGLYENLFPDNLTAFNRYETEYEVWMRATPYYTSVDEKEIVNDTAWDQTDNGEPGRGGLYECINEIIAESVGYAQMREQDIVAVARQAFAGLYPGVKLYAKPVNDSMGFSTDEEGAGIASAYALGGAMKDEFYLTVNAYAWEDAMNVVVEDATAGEYKGAVTAIIKALFEAGERLFKSTKRELVVKENANYDAWVTIANRLGAELVD